MDLVHSCLAPIKTVAKKRNGEAGRICKRRREINKGHRTVDRFIAEQLPELASLPAKTISNKTFLARAANLFKTINQACPDRAVGTVWKRFCEFIDVGNAQRHWTLPALARVLELPADILARDAAWQSSAILLHLNDQRVRVALEEFDIDSLSAEHWLGLIVYFAATRSGLCGTDALSALVTSLVGRTPFFRIGEDEVYMPITVADVPYTNVSVCDVRCRLQRFYPDALTLALINRYYAAGKTLDEAVWDKLSLIRWINKSLRRLDRDIVKFSTLGQLGQVALSIEELHTPIPQIYLEAAFGRNRESALPESYWRLVNQLEAPTKVDWGAPTVVLEPAAISVPTYQRASKKNFPIDRIYTALHDAVRRPKNGALERTPAEAIRHLESLDTDRWPLGGQMLCAWGIYHLQERGNAVSTLRTYFSNYGKGLLRAMHDRDTWDGDDLFDVYQEVILEKDRAEYQAVTARRLTDFHQFARARFGLPGLLEPLTDSGAGRAHVRAAYIPHATFLQGLALIPKLDGRSKYYCRQLQLLWILAYRSGLRRNELIRLQVSDIEPSRDLWLFVRNNVVAKGKTSSARRKIPLAVLLTKDELKLFRKHLHSCRKRKGAAATLLFADESGHKNPLDPSRVSSDIARIFNALEVPGSLHSLRHTALSRLQLIAEQEWSLLMRFTDYSADTGRLIYTAIFDHEYVRHERYRALAAFAGHASPGITLSTYLHFSELILHERLKRSTQTYSPALVSNITGLSQRKLNKLTREVGCGKSAIPQAVFRQTVVGSCKRILHAPQSVESTPEPQIDLIALAISEITLARIYECLDAFQRGARLKHLPYEYGIALAKIEQYIENAQILAALTTQKGNPRLVSKRRLESIEHPLLPSPLNSLKMRDDAEHIKKVFGDHLKTHGDDIAWTLVYFLTHVTTTEPYITFRRPEDIERFLRTCDLAIVRKRWRIELFASPGESEKLIRRHWKLHACYRTSVHRSSGARRGHRARLYYSGEGEAALVESFNRTALHDWTYKKRKRVRKDNKRPMIEHYSASTLRYLFHLLAIVWLKPESLAKRLADHSNERHSE